MADHKHSGLLGSVYEAGSPEEITALYDRWAATYDAEMAATGYRHPSIGLALISRHLPRGSSPVLDAGAGTGLLGEWLAIMGYPNVEALDISEGMLAVAERKGCYRKLHKLALGGPLPFADGHFAGITAVGVFSTGHVGPEGLDELIRICRGVVVLTIKLALWEKNFGAAVAEHVRAGRLTVAEETPPYVSMPGEKATTPSKGMVLKVR